jgi:CubicO group peptidase (beta-lactamase class C family)
VTAPPLDGTCAERFAPVRDRFAGLLADGSETGASVCAYVGGEPVVDLWGGWADAARTRPWTRDTIVTTYSVTKAPAAVTVLTLVDRGLLGLDDLVTRVWPEYGVAGKEGTTVRQLLAHRAGLPAFPEPRPDPAAWTDWDDLAGMLARATPEWEPGTAHAEHAYTYGHLLGEVVRRVDGRTLGQVWREDVAAGLGLDFQIGLRDDEVARAAEVEYATPSWPADVGGAPGSLRERAVANPAGARDLGVLNSDLWRRAEIPAVNGHGTAHAVARFYAAVTGRLQVPLLSDGLRAELLSPVASGYDALLDRDVTWGLGVQFEESYVGMGGLGGNDGIADVERGYSFGYVTRRLGDHERAIALSETVESCL